MYAGGMSYVSKCFFGFIGRVSAEAGPMDMLKSRKIESALAAHVENFIR
jgi:hypothetical protein